MAEQNKRKRLPPLPGLIAGGLVILGMFLWMFVAKGFLLVVGLGAFGLGILRELGWLRDQDEFQRQAAHRAGYLAYLTAGTAAVIATSGLHLGDADQGRATEWLQWVLVVMWITWLFSSMLRYWGARKTTRAVLIVFGSFWALFVGAHMFEDPLALLPGLIFVAPFFVLAWTAGRWPRKTGIALIGVAAVFLVLAAPSWVARSLDTASALFTATLLVVPILSCGIALLREGSSDSETVDEAETKPASTP